MKEGELLKELVEEEDITCVMLTLFDYLLCFETFKYMQLSISCEDTFDIFMCKSVLYSYTNIMI